MSCVEEVMKRNKTESSGHAHSRIPPPTSISSSSTPIKKLSNSNINLSEVSEAVGDLINLETSEVVFDPLLDNQRFSQNPHKKLERTSNVQNGDVRNGVAMNTCYADQKAWHLTRRQLVVRLFGRLWLYYINQNQRSQQNLYYTGKKCDTWLEGCYFLARCHNFLPL